MRKICVVTGTRAEYGLLSRLMMMIKDDVETELQIIATNMHLATEYGLTYKEIENDGFLISKKVEMLLSSDTSNATTKSVGLATIGFADAYEDLKPDIIVILGDRYEMLAAVTAALLYKIPVAHLHGGEITEGVYDDSIRHAISKMSHLHFTATDVYRNRVIQLGEQPDSVFNVGAIGIDNIKNTNYLSKQELENYLCFDLGEKSILVTYHPVTLEDNTAKEQILNLLEVLNSFKDLKIIFTMPNSDTGGKIIANSIDEFVKNNKDRAIAVKSLGQKRYFSALRYVMAVVGNSSSGILEVPSFGIPTLNIGDRQKGRIMGESIVNCGTSKDEIIKGLNKVFSMDIDSKKQNPYEKENTCANIFAILKSFSLSNIIKKSFYDTL